MRTTKIIYVFMTAMVALPLFAVADDQNDDDIETIVVTATRQNEKNLDVAASIGSKDSEQVELDAAAQQKELFNSIAGVRITQTGSTLGHMTSIRMPLNTGPYYLFLQDGVPVQSSGFFNHNGLAYTNFSSAGRAEVLKGAGTALYGSDAIAATINVISKDTSMDEGVKLNAEAGSDDFQKFGVGYGHMLDAANIGIQASKTQSDGWRDHTASKREEFNATHELALEDGGRLKTILGANRTKAEMAGSLIGLNALETDPASVGDIQSALDSGLDIERKFDFTRLSSEWNTTLSDNTSLSAIAYLRSTRNQYTATWQRNLPHNDSQQDSFGMLLKATTEQMQTRIISGLDLELTNASLKYTQLFDYTPSGYGAPVPAGDIYDYDVRYIALAPYIRAEYHWSDKINIAAGLRYDTNAFDYTNNTADGQYAGSSYLRASSDNDPTFRHLSPKLSLAYRLSAQSNSYIRYANGFRIPQASRLYSLNTRNIDFTLDPETTNTLEIGYKFEDRTMALDLAIYRMEINDSIVQRENAAGDRYYVNGGETRHEGVELTLSKHINTQFTTRIAYSESRHHYVNDAVYGNNDQADAPKNTANLRLIYRPSALPGLVSMLEFEHIGKYWLDDNNTRSYAGYTLSNFKALYHASKRLTLNIKVNNIADKIYAENASYRYGKEKYTPGAPRQFLVGLEYRL